MELTREFLARRRDEKRHEYDLRLSELHGAAALLVDRGDIGGLRRWVEAADAAQRAWTDASVAFAQFERGLREPELFEKVQ